MYNGAGLIPARFLTLTAHLAVSVELLWSSHLTARSCLADSYTEGVFYNHHTQWVISEFWLLVQFPWRPLFWNTITWAAVTPGQGRCFRVQSISGVYDLRLRAAVAGNGVWWMPSVLKYCVRLLVDAFRFETLRSFTAATLFACFLVISCFVAILCLSICIAVLSAIANRRNSV